MFSIALTLHILAAVIWVGGMFFAYCLLRPALQEVGDIIQDPQRLALWASTFKKFFPWVWLCIVVLLATGFYMVFLLGGFSAIGLHIYTMLGLAVVMIAIFKFVHVAPFRHLCQAVENEKWEVATYALGTIRKLVAFNLGLGVLIIIIATAFAGRI